METIDTGLSMLDKEIKNLKSKIFSPEIAFKLYDTYGFPIDVTKNILSEKNIKLDLKKYEQIVLDNKSKQKNTWVGSGENTKDDVFINLKEKVKKTSFLGYDQVVSKSKLICILNQGKIVNRVEKNQKDIILIFDKTPFYAEGGGKLEILERYFALKNNLIANVSDTQKVDGDIFLHFVGKNLENLCVNQTFKLSVNEERRVKIRNNHSATHLLHASLRSVLGDHISQKGSLVNEEKLRFDFTYNEQLSDNDVNKIESLVNQMIRANIDSKIEYLPTKKAIKTGAIALFGEKYPEKCTSDLI